MKTVYYRGIEGSYSSIAAKVYTMASIPRVGVASFKAVVDAVAGDEKSLGVLPIQNSLSGAIRETYDLLKGRELRIIGEWVLPIDHAWMALPGAKHEDIQEIVSHPEALYQCQRFIESKGLTAVQGQDTATCAKSLAEMGIKHQSVIAHRDVAGLYGLQILQSDIVTESRNRTRFIIFEKGTAQNGGTKMTLYIEIENRRNALYKVISQLVICKVNIINIETRPLDRNFEIGFFLDLDLQEASDHEAIVKALIPHTEQVSVLGIYEAHCAS